MPHISSSSIKRRKTHSATAAIVLIVLAGLLLAACGSSSTSSDTSSTSASATTSTTGGPAGAAGASRFTAVRECLAKNGITLPKRTPGQRPSPGAGGFPGGGGGFTLPKGVTKAQYEAAIKKCGGFPRGGGGRFAGGAAGFNTPAAKAALTKYAACLRENGVNVPAPNTSGNGPVFNDKGLNTSSAKFTAAEAKCRSILQSIFRARPGGAAAPGGPSTAG